MARKILLADDSVTAQNMGRKILVDAGYDVLTVNNGSAALKRITESKPDLIVLDVYMPGYSGLEVCQRLKESGETSHIPVLLTVGKLEPFKPEEARRVRADGHIVKPFEASELLSALARLEDRMVPSNDGPRFNTKVAGVERFAGEEDSPKPEANADTDTGWKSRLRFPSKKKKEEPEPEEDAANFREFRKGKGKAAGVVLPTNVPVPAGQEPGLVPDIPRDITPEELDVLSALAAKLDGPIPESEKIASLAEKVGPAEAVPAKAEEAVAAPVAEVKAAEEPKKEFEVTATATDSVAAAAPAAEVKNVVEIPVEHTESAAEVAAVEPARTPEVELPAAVSAASLAQEAAPIDQQDEPMFASATATVETKAAEAVASEAASPSAESVAKAEESKEQEKKIEEAKVEVAESKPEEVRPVEATPVAAEEPAPTDEELAEALRLLTPSPTNGEAPMPSHGVLAAAGQMLAEEAARNGSAGLRWMAQAVALSPEEAAMSLEAEMFRTFAPNAGPESAAAVVDRVSMITAAVENRLAEADLIPASAPNSGSASIAQEPSAQSPAAEQPSTVPTVTESEKKDSTAATAETASEEAAPAATFADASAQEEAAPAISKQDAVVQAGTPASDTVAGGEASQDSSQESGGQDDMGKDGKGKSGSAKWHQIHTPATGAASTNDAVEAAKQAAAGTDETPKAMAAAAAAEGSGTASEANAIASIVDSVLADLRPKIVEEIAKKLGKK